MAEWEIVCYKKSKQLSNGRMILKRRSGYVCILLFVQQCQSAVLDDNWIRRMLEGCLVRRAEFSNDRKDFFEPIRTAVLKNT